MIGYRIITLTIGFFLDLLLGDPVWLYHPVLFIGKQISFLEKWIRKLFPVSKRGELWGGAFLVLLVCLASAGIPWMCLHYLYPRWKWAGLILESFWCFQMLAARSLKTESMKVYEKLKNGNLAEARNAVSRIVGRDTKALSREGVIKAAVETVAENTSDGELAPLLYLAAGGVPLLFLYKAINTMDSMVGYKNDTYLYFGRCAARLDDLANLLPSRISGLLMAAAAFLLPGYDGKNAFRVFLRDRYQHASPNSAQTEAAMAGALRIQLAGNAYYFGMLYEKPTIGDPLREVEAEDIPRANRLMYATSFLGFFSCLMVLLAFFSV